MSATPPIPPSGGAAAKRASVWDTDGWWTEWKGAQPELTVDDKVALAKEVAEGGEIISDEKELRALFERKQNPVAYARPLLVCVCVCLCVGLCARLV